MSSGIALALAICIIAGLLLSGVVVIFEVRKTPKQEAEMMSARTRRCRKVKEDPREMARWVPQ